METAAWRGYWAKAAGALALGAVVACGKTSGPAPSDDGGADGSGGRRGSGGTSSSGGGPITTNRYVETISQKTVDKIDLLFMIDNSISMADKQAVLREAVPDLIRRLVSPRCVNSEGVARQSPADPDAVCPDGYDREFTPIRNMHVGVITSSLGGHGAEICSGSSPGTRGEQENDHGHLIATRPRFAAAGTPAQPVDALGFLNWQPRTGEQSIAAFTSTFQLMVTAASEFGCGYESQLEAIYRFLADPNPYANIAVAPCSATNSNPCAFPTGRDETLLAQRRAFLRPDSVVGIVMISDENDCSIIEQDQGYYAARADDVDLPRSASACATNPNDRCCVSCIAPAPAGCATDTQCASNPVTPEELDPPNLRCFNNKKRFGIDFLYPTQRYVNALTQKKLCTSNKDLSIDPANEGDCPDRDGDGAPDLFPNPLFADLSGIGALPRDPQQVFFAGILGVPWQDLQADTDSEGNAHPPGELHYLSAAELAASGTWDKILGVPRPPNGAAPIPPTDQLMAESLAPRGGNDGQGTPLAPPNSQSLANPVNSHEWGNVRQDDLQYACVFRLAEPRDCDAVSRLAEPKPGCDCEEVRPGDFNPLCQNPNSNEYGKTQYFAKAYPGLRQLEVLQGIGENAVVASICARNLTDASAQDYGYRPAMDAVADRFRPALTGRCLPRSLEPSASCEIIEARPGGDGCDRGRRRMSPSAEVESAVRDRLESDGVCGGAGQPDCDAFRICSLFEAGEACHQTGEQPEVGWCYIDPSQNPDDDPALVEKCPENQKRIIRFVDPENRTPEPDARMLIVCEGPGRGLP